MGKLQSTVLQRRNRPERSATNREGKHQPPVKVVVPTHGGFFSGIAVHDDFVGDAFLAGGIDARSGHRRGIRTRYGPNSRRARSVCMSRRPSAIR